MEYSAIRWADEPYTTYCTSGPKARDGIEMARILHGGDLGDRTVLLGVVNSLSPLIWDFRMADALMTWAEANQAVVVTPFLLAGATAPVSVSGGIAQQVAEELSGFALAQLVRPGVPCLYGSFFTATDMRTGAPAFGTPESVFGVLAGAQMARRYGLPYRGGGGLASSPAVDAQAAAETQIMLWATMLAGTDVVLHAAGWLEGGLVASLEKFAGCSRCKGTSPMVHSVNKDRTLVVDDAPTTLEVLQRNLTSQGYQVFTAPGVPEAINVLETTPVDLVITDLKMPGASGLDRIRHVRENFKETEVMMITGYPTIESAVKAVKTGRKTI